MKHCMIDIETLSSRPTAAIVSIGACKFDNEHILEKFYVNISAADCKKHGLHFSPETIEWWSHQPKEARQQWQKDPVDLNTGLDAFIDWYGTRSLWTWSNGADFDLPILENAMWAVGKETPWKYTDSRCVRTITGITKRKIDRSEGTAHNALDDAINQAKFIQEFLKAMDL